MGFAVSREMLELGERFLRDAVAGVVKVSQSFHFKELEGTLGCWGYSSNTHNDVDQTCP